MTNCICAKVCPFSVICLEPMLDGEMVRLLPCGHVFHSSCITLWYLRHHPTCPMCKVSYVPKRSCL
ncbi:hypothetical protein GQ53DRAFT_640025 [Thozetella sp. PMI_491]|nr:hypothetical protein GQ53DRAFT_640025 [Thozetella sp. PMI_491]